MATGGITWAGMRLAKISGGIHRKPHVTGLEAEVLTKIPDSRAGDSWTYSRTCSPRRE